jgi:hypothetical protein
MAKSDEGFPMSVYVRDSLVTFGEGWWVGRWRSLGPCSVPMHVQRGALKFLRRCHGGFRAVWVVGIPVRGMVGCHMQCV